MSQEESPKLYPTVVFAIGKKDIKDRILKAFQDSGMTALILETADDIMAATERLEVFAIFIDVEHDKNLTLMLESLVPGSRLRWILLSPSLNLSKSSVYRNMGFADVLFHPVHPVLMQSRARLMLSRYIKEFDFPPEVILPPGMSAKELRSKSSALSDDDDNHLINVSSGGKEDDAIVVKGSAGNGENSVHVKGSKSDDIVNSAGMLKGDFHAESMKIVKADAEPEWNNHNNRDPGNAGTRVNYMPPESQFEPSSSKIIAGEQASKALSAASSQPPDLQQNNDLRNLIEKLHNRVQILDVAAKNSADYPNLRIPNESDPNAVYVKGFELCREEIRNLLIDCKARLMAANILLLSFTPNIGEERYTLISSSDPIPAKDLGKTNLLPEWLVPEITLALEKNSAISIDQEHYATEDWKNLVGKGWTENVGNDAPLAMSVLPLFRRQANSRPMPMVCLLIVYSHALGMPERAAIEEILGVLSLPYHHYSHVDFLNRVYKGLV